MKKYIRILLLIPMVIFLTAMAQRGDEAPIKVPETGTNIKVVITDIKGLKTELTEFSMDGKEVTMLMRGGSVFYGNTEFGPFKIEAESVSRIEVIGNHKTY